MDINFDFDYLEYAENNNLWSLLGVNKSEYGDVSKKIIPDYANYSVDPNVLEAYPPELDDLIRIHYLVRNLKVVTALEIGAGKSTVIIADALEKNKQDFGKYVEKNLRKNNAFELHSVETSKFWAESVLKTIPKNLSKFCNMNIVDCKMDTFNSRVCTTFENFPNICPDFIYLDGPDQYSPSGDVNGISTNHPDRMPMVSDINRIEPFLLPGTVILVDGRTANARFIKNNLQNQWNYKHYKDFDIHIFVNDSEALGIYNKKELTFKKS
ncbi:hypothetical protein HOL24_00255 [bacterium]|jgi:hypothetical protein|nr:hypothetical protein [bacterium]